MRVHYLQHVPFEGLGSIGPWLQAAGHAATRWPLYESPALPAPSAFDALIALGGPMSVNDESQFPWLAPEKALVREAALAGKPILGICLGAQLLANSLGARVYRNPVKEIGWFPVEPAPISAAMGSRGGLFSFPAPIVAFHWHGETFDLPAGAAPLARNGACENQAFQLGRRAIGLQFHLETTPDSIRDLIAHCGDELVAGPGIQGPEAMLAPGPSAFAGLNGEMGRVLDFLLGP